MDAVIEWIKGVYTAIMDFFQRGLDFFDTLIEWFQTAYDDFWNSILVFPTWAFSKLGEGIVSFFNELPVPSFFSTAGDAFGGIATEVAYFAAPMQIGPGITMVLSAYLLRFIIRRIPIIG